MNELEKIIELLKSEDKIGILYYDVNRLYFDNSKWFVRGGTKKGSAVLYCGDSLSDALKALRTG